MASNVRPLTKDDLLAQVSSNRSIGRSQSTAIEQSRAIAEVQGALMVADRRPRNKPSALAEALESCRTKEVAESAFYKFPRAGGAVEGESIHLARELARCWGNITFGIVELDRDDNRAVSEMMAYAWDLESNTRPETRFLVPHKRDTRSGPSTLTDMRDIYENNANMGARRLRECIFAVLPPYLVRAAAEECKLTLAKGGGVPLAVRINDAVKAFDAMGIKLARLEAKYGPSAGWSDMDIVNLEISYKSIKRKEVSAEEEFPAKPLTAEMLGEGDAESVLQTNAADHTNGDQHVDEQAAEDDQPPYVAQVAEWKAAFARHEIMADWATLADEIHPHLAALPDMLREDLIKARDDAKARLRGDAK